MTETTDLDNEPSEAAEAFFTLSRTISPGAWSDEAGIVTLRMTGELVTEYDRAVAEVTMTPGQALAIIQALARAAQAALRNAVG